MPNPGLKKEDDLVTLVGGGGEGSSYFGDPHKVLRVSSVSASSIQPGGRSAETLELCLQLQVNASLQKASLCASILLALWL